ncbi:transposase [Deinococcus pimensis]|uniref:transposase n=1 Tax=Deinococcus pimensis TaxID=309888 RepID=UPI0009FD1798|nr:transposase [Deinococcus pimensis]
MTGRIVRRGQLAFYLTSGERHEMQELIPLLDSGQVKRTGRGRPKLPPLALAADRGYSSYATRNELQRRGIRPVIPPKRDLKRSWRYDREQYRKRHHVEQMVNRLKRYHRVATRYEKRGWMYLAVVMISAIREWAASLALL